MLAGAAAQHLAQGLQATRTILWNCGSNRGAVGSRWRRGRGWVSALRLSLRRSARRSPVPTRRSLPQLLLRFARRLESEHAASTGGSLTKDRSRSNRPGSGREVFRASGEWHRVNYRCHESTHLATQRTTQA